jgi:serine/threonine protein kinase
MVHSDIKPTNILIAENGSIRLGDVAGAVAIGQNIQMYTEIYAAPEILEGRGTCAPLPAWPPVDAWSVGATIFEMLFGTYYHKWTECYHTLPFTFAIPEAEWTERASGLGVSVALFHVMNELLRPEPHERGTCAWAATQLTEGKIMTVRPPERPTRAVRSGYVSGCPHGHVTPPPAVPTPAGSSPPGSDDDLF